MHRGPDEAELLPQPALDEAQVAGLDRPEVNSTNVGGPAWAWVPNRIRGCLPPRTGCGWAATIRPRKAFSLPVEIRVSQLCSAS